MEQSEKTSQEYNSLDEVKPIEKSELGIRELDKEKINVFTPSEKNMFLQQKYDEIKRQIEELKKKQEEQNRKIEDNDKAIDQIDDDLPTLREQLDNARRNLEKKGISLADKDNPLVKDYDLQAQLIENKIVVKKTLVDESDKLKKDNEACTPLINELEKQNVLLERIRQQSNQERIKKEEQKAEKNVYSPNVSIQSNPILTLLDAFLKNVDYNQRTRQAGASAVEHVTEQIAMEDMRVKEQRLKNQTVDIKENKDENKTENEMKQKDALVLLAHTADGKTIIRVLDVKQAVEYAQSEEAKSLKEALDKEKDLPVEQRKTSVLTMKHANIDELLEAIKPVAGNSVKFHEELHTYATTDGKKQRIIDALAQNCQFDDARGGNFFSSVMQKKQEQAEKSQSQEQTTKTEKQQSSGIVPSPSPRIIIPWDEIEKKYHISRNVILDIDKERLANRQPSGIYTTASGMRLRLYPQLDPATNKPTLAIVKEPRQKLAVPDFDGLQKKINLSKADVDNLREFGLMNHSIKIGDKEGYLYLNKNDNRFYFRGVDEIKISETLKKQLSADTLEQLKKGSPAHVDNLKDNKGQKFTGWIMIDPHKGEVRPCTKKPAFHVDNEYKIQVANNNHGERDESVKYDKDTVLKSKQIKNDDGIDSTKEQVKHEKNETTKKYKDYSETETTETETTEKRQRL